MLWTVALSAEDRLEIYELLALHGHLVDAGKLDGLGELFTQDFVYDVEALGYGILEGAEAFAGAARALGDDNPLGHHVTNALVTEAREGQARRPGTRNGRPRRLASDRSARQRARRGGRRSAGH